MLPSVVSHADFLALRARGARLRTPNLRARFVPGPTPQDSVPRVAFAVGRSFGNAVQRNRARRRLRHALAEALERFEAPARRPLVGDLLVSCSPRVLDLPYQSLIGECSLLLASAASKLPSDAA